MPTMIGSALRVGGSYEPGQNNGAAHTGRSIYRSGSYHCQFYKHHNQMECNIMIVHTKHREKDPWPIAGNMSPHDWKSSTVTLSDIFLNDSRNKLADAVHNTSDSDLVAAFGATNRLLQTYRMASDRSTCDEDIDHLALMKNLMEDELCIRLRAGRAKLR